MTDNKEDFTCQEDEYFAISRDELTRRALLHGYELGYKAGWRDGIAAGRRLAKGKSLLPKRRGRPAKSRLSDHQFLDTIRPEPAAQEPTAATKLSDAFGFTFRR